MFKVDSSYYFILIYKVTNFDIREDPKWKSQTYMKAAEVIGISPTQTYKWGTTARSNKAKAKQRKEEEKLNLREVIGSDLQNRAKRI